MGLHLVYISSAKSQKICTNNGYKDSKCSICLGNDYNLQSRPHYKGQQPFRKFFYSSNQIKLRLRSLGILLGNEKNTHSFYIIIKSDGSYPTEKESFAPMVTRVFCKLSCN